MNISNLYVVITYWPDGDVTYSTPYRGKDKAFRNAMQRRELGADVEIVTDREAGERKMRGAEGLGEME